MHTKLSTQRRSERFHVVAAASGAAVALTVALASAGTADVGFGMGVELALARTGGGVEAPEWIQIFPKGPEIKARDGRRWTLEDPQVVIDAFAANQADLPLDLNHASELLGPKGGDAPAQAWVKQLEIRNGEVWAQLAWNDAGRLAVTSGAYRYVSPAFMHTKDGKITSVRSVALVTQPALVMPALAHQQQTTPETSPMSLSARLIAALCLSAAASDDQIYEAVTGQVALARDARDPAKLVPAADLTAALARASVAEAALAQINTDTQDAVALTAVEAAIEAGKIAPSSKDHWLSIAKSSPDAFTAAIAAMSPTLTPPSKTDKKPDGAGQDEHGLTEQQLATARSLGVEPAAYAATLKE